MMENDHSETYSVLPLTDAFYRKELCYSYSIFQ